MQYKPYPKKKDTPSRKARKTARNVAFNYNKYELKRRVTNVMGQ